MSTSFIKSSPKTQYATPSDIPQPSTEYPVIAGTASPGVSGTFSRGDHVHPAETVAIGADGYGLPGECYPIEYTYNGVQYTVTSNSEISFEPYQEWVVHLNDYRAPATVATFNYDTLKFSSSPSAITNLRFGGVAPTSDVFPTLVRDKVFVRNVEVAKAADLDGYVPTDRTVNSKALSSDVTLYGSDITVTSESGADTIDTALGKKLDKSGGTMSGNLTLSGSAPTITIDATSDEMQVIFRYYGIQYNSNMLSYPIASGTLALVQNIAPYYSTSGTYVVGQLVAKDSTLKICTTAGTGLTAVFADATVEDVLAAIRSTLALKAPLASPEFTGTPTAPTPAAGDDSTKVATTAFVQDALSGITPVPDNNKLNSTSAAPAFSTSATYAVGDYVTHDGDLYVCSTAVAASGSWSGSTNWTETDMTSPDATLDITSQNALRVVAADGTTLWHQGYTLMSASSSTLMNEAVNLYEFTAQYSGVAEFSTASSYAADDVVSYNGKPYKFNAAHSAGAWTGTDADLDLYTQSFTLPYAPTGKVCDFILDVDNTANTLAVAVGITDYANLSVNLAVPSGDRIDDMLTIDGGVQTELYFTKIAFKVDGKPTWKVVRQDVDIVGAGS